MKQLRTAVVGLGRIGWQFHLPQIRQHDGFTLVAVVDPLAERREEAQHEYGVKGYADFDALLANEMLDLVVIASPTHLHADQAITAMRRGLDVFCDKPMAPTLTEADRMIAAMAETGRKLMVYQPHRATPEAEAVRHLLAENLLGHIFMIKRACAWYRRRNDWQSLTQYGGGMLNNYGAHYIDQLLYLMHSPAREITCQLRTIASLGDADDVVKAVITLANGALLDLDINMAAAQPLPAWVIMGKYGTAVFDGEKNAFTARYCREDELTELHLEDGLAATGRRYDNDAPIHWHEREFPLSAVQPIDFYAKCYAYYAQDQAPFVPVQETREVMRVIEACRQDTPAAV